MIFNYLEIFITNFDTFHNDGLAKNLIAKVREAKTTQY